MRPVQRRVLSSVILVLLTALWGRSADAQTTERVSVASGGTEGNGASLSSALSADGRFVAFVSAATDLVAADTNGVSDVFVHDRQTGATERVSVASGGAQGDGSSGLIGFAFPRRSRPTAASSRSSALRPASSPATRTARPTCSSATGRRA